MKEKFQKVGRIFGGCLCTVAGLALAGFGVGQFLPKKKYAGPYEIGTSKDEETSEESEG